MNVALGSARASALRSPLAAGWLIAAGLALLAAALPAAAQRVSATITFAHNVIVPQARSFAMTAQRPQAELTQVDVKVDILEQTATTAMEISLRNPSGSRIEAELVLPVPENAAVRGFTFQGAGPEPTAQLLPKDEARRIYDAIVAQTRDPALLEFVGLNLIRSSVFPLEAHGTQKVRITYEELLPVYGKRVDYVLPRTDSLDYAVPWNVSVTIKAKQPIATVFSPSHALQVTPEAPLVVRAKFTGFASREPGPFRLSYLLADQAVSASLFAYPDPKVGGGYFLLLAGLPVKPVADAAAPRKEVTLVIDRSGSMHGEKIAQVREAARQLIGGLADGDYFNLITYNENVDLFAPAPVAKTEATRKQADEFITNILPRGGTNIHDALLEALRQKTAGDQPFPIVLFLSDGLPTMGNTAEKDIRDLVVKANPHRRRVFTFGVGLDVNVPLLETIARASRGSCTFVLPKEDVEVKVGMMFDRLTGPLITDPKLLVLDPAGQPTPNRVRELVPGSMQDIYAGDQLVILGQYLGEGPLNFSIQGTYQGKPKDFRFAFTLDQATTRNGFVARQWAVRKIDLLVSGIRELGGDLEKTGNAAFLKQDPRFKELVDEIVKLSTEFGILTEYTSFLAREGTNLADLAQLQVETERNLRGRALGARSGVGSYNQFANDQSANPMNGWVNAKMLDPRSAQGRNDAAATYGARGGGGNLRNAFYDQNLNRVETSAVQQFNGRAYYQRGAQRVDAHLVQKGQVQADQTIAIGSPEHQALVDRLARENRQGELAQPGELLLEVDGRAVMVK